MHQDSRIDALILLTDMTSFSRDPQTQELLLPIPFNFSAAGAYRFGSKHSAS